MTNLTSLVVIDPSPPRHMKFPRDLSAMEKLCSVDVGCREIPLPLGTLPNLQHLTLRGLRPSCRGSHDPERVRTRDSNIRKCRSSCLGQMVVKEMIAEEPLLDSSILRMWPSLQHQSKSGGFCPAKLEVLVLLLL